MSYILFHPIQTGIKGQKTRDTPENDTAQYGEDKSPLG